MSSEIKEVMRRAEELGVDVKDLISAMLRQDGTDIMDLIGREVENGRNLGLSADHVFHKLSDLFGEEQIATYLGVQSLVDGIMSPDGLKIDMGFHFEGLDFLKTNRELIHCELKRRGVKEVGYVSNSKLGIFTIQTGECVYEMPAWYDLYDDKQSEIMGVIHDSLEEFLRDNLGEGYECVDIRKEVDQALAYKDIWDVLHNEDTSGFSKHEWDIYFAFRIAVNAPIYYFNAGIERELVRLYEYWYQNYEDILNVLNAASNLSVYRDGCVGYLSQLGEYDSFGELICQMADAAMEDWHDYGRDEIWGTEYI